MTRALYVITALAAILSAINAALIAWAGVATGEFDISTTLLWVILTFLFTAALRCIRWARRHGYHPGFHRR